MAVQGRHIRDGSLSDGDIRPALAQVVQEMLMVVRKRCLQHARICGSGGSGTLACSLITYGGEEVAWRYRCSQKKCWRAEHPRSVKQDSQ